MSIARVLIPADSYGSRLLGSAKRAMPHTSFSWARKWASGVATMPVTPVISIFSPEIMMLFSRGLLRRRSEEHTSELQSLMRISYAVFCLKKQRQKTTQHKTDTPTHSVQ